jgi:hypothetical protein
VLYMYTKGHFKCWSKVQNLKDSFETKMWDSHVKGLGWHFILFYHFSHGSFVLLALQYTHDEHMHKIFMVLILIMTMHQVIGIFFFLAYLLCFSKNLSLSLNFKSEKKSLQNFIKLNITKVSSKLEFNLFFSYFLQI